jgi:hypothetical protein
MSNITDIEKLNFYSWTDDGMDENPNGIPSEDVFVLRSDVLKVLRQNNVSDVSAEDVLGKYYKKYKKRIACPNSVIAAMKEYASIVNERKDKLPLEWSPVESEKKWQEEQFKILFPNIENDQPDWQRLNFFIEAALKYLEKNERKDNVGVSDAIEFAIYTNDKAWFDEDTGLWNLHDEEADPFRLTSGEMYQQFKLYSQPQQKEVDEEITAPSFEECPKCHHSLCICEIKGTI